MVARAKDPGVLGRGTEGIDELPDVPSGRRRPGDAVGRLVKPKKHGDVPAQVTFLVSRAEKRKLDAAAKRRRLSLSDLIRSWIDGHIERLPEG